MGCDFYVEHWLNGVGVDADGADIDICLLFRQEKVYRSGGSSIKAQMNDARKGPIVLCKDGEWLISKDWIGYHWYDDLDGVKEACMKVSGITRVKDLTLNSNPVHRL